MEKSPFKEIKIDFMFRFLSDFWGRIVLRRRLLNATFFFGAVLATPELFGQDWSNFPSSSEILKASSPLETAPSARQNASVLTPQRRRAKPQKNFEPPLFIPNSSNVAASRTSRSTASRPSAERKSFNDKTNSNVSTVSNGTVATPRISVHSTPSGFPTSAVPSLNSPSLTSTPKSTGSSNFVNSNGSVRPAEFSNSPNWANASQTAESASFNSIRSASAVEPVVASYSESQVVSMDSKATDVQVGATSDWQDASAFAPEAASDLASASNRPETLAEAMELAVSSSRKQQALALRTGASRSTVNAARSLAAPKVTNATAYVGMTNQPTIRSDVDLSGLGSAIPPSLAPMFSGLPTSIEALTPVSDKDFVASSTAVTLPVYLGGRVQALIRSAEALTEAASAGEEIGEQNVRFETSEAYFLVLRTRKLHEVASEATRTAAEHLADAERMFNVGMLTKNVVLAAQVALAETRQTELRVANAQLLSEAAYNRLLWRPLDAAVNIAEVELSDPLGDFDALAARATRNRAELNALSAQSRAMREQEKVARADVLPQVALVGAYSYVENSSLTENSNATGAVGMVWTPFDGGTSRARRNAARQDALALAKARDEAESAIRLQVYQAWLAEKEARERVEVARTAVEQSEENYRVVTRGFQEGIVNHTEVLDALTLRTTAKSAFANAQYDSVLAAQRALRAVGEL